MLSYKDFIGKKIGELYVLYRVGTAKNRTPILKCLCSCGNYTDVRANHLMHKHTVSCGCIQPKAVSKACINNLIGKRFGMLTVVSLNKRRMTRATYWDCICDCGNKTTVFVRNLHSGKTRSCGCLKKNNSGKLLPLAHKLKGYCKLWSNKDFKYYIFNRDNYICQNPYCYKITNRLVIHHIDYDKKNCHPNNLITVCNSCNARANKDRDWHKEWYQILMNKKFGYDYGGFNGN